MESKNIIGSKVKEARKNAKPPISQTDLIARLEILGISLSQSSLSKLENGLRPVPDIELVAIARALKVSPQWLLGTDSV